MIFSYGLVLALFLLAPGFGVYAGLFSGAHLGVFRPGAPAPRSVLTLGVVVIGALVTHALWASACAFNDLWAGAGLPTLLPPVPSAYDILMEAVVARRAAGDIGIAVFLSTASLLTLGAFVATAWLVGRPWVRPFHARFIYGWLSGLVEASENDDTFILAFVLSDIVIDNRSLGYQGGVLNLTVNENKQITGVVLKDASAFYLDLGDDAVRHVPIPRREPINQIYIDGPQIKNIAFETYAFGD
jgi:hypothetical protein